LEYGYEDGDEEVLSETTFRVAISFETDGPGPEKKKLWNEVDIKRRPVISNMSTPTTPACLPGAVRVKRARFVAIAKAQSAFSTSSSKPSFRTGKPPDIKLAVADVARHPGATSLSADITRVNLPDTPAETLALAVSTTSVDILQDSQESC